jgi:hypothetical protein
MVFRLTAGRVAVKFGRNGTTPVGGEAVDDDRVEFDLTGSGKNL